MHRTFGKGTIELVRGDITRETTDAIVNAANSRLAGGGGVDGAIHRAGGPEIMAECRAIGGCATGQAVITAAGRLSAKKVIHAVGPIWTGGANREPLLLAGCYRNALELAAAHGLESVAFPSLSTGAFGYPVEQAARVALEAVKRCLSAGGGVKRVRFVLFDERTLAAYEAALAGLE